MLEIYPKVGEGKGYICPVCKCQLSQPQRVVFKSSAVVADIECTCCEEAYYQTLPYEFSQQPKLSFLKKYGKIKYDPLEEARALLLLKAIQQEPDVCLEIIKENPTTQALWLNCLVEEEEEVLRKLILSTPYLSEHENLGFVVLIKEELAYLVPDSVSEIWKVRYAGSSCRPLNEWISAELPRFQKLYLPLLDNNMESRDISWERFFKVPPFRSEVSGQTTIVTFFCHPSLYWQSTKWEKLLFKLSDRWDLLSLFKSYFEKRQLHKFRTLAEKLGQLRPIEFYVIGFGKEKVSSLFHDERQEEEKTGGYQKWISVLARTEVAIGVFGGKLPARILSGYCLELQAEDTEESPFFLPKGTFFKGLTSVKEVCNHVEKILKKERVVEKQ